MEKYFKKLLLLQLVLIITAAIGCEVPVPIKEMSLAKYEMSRALSVKADKYAPKELKESKDKLYECHGLVKKEDWDKAKAAGVKSHIKAKEAYEKSVPLLAGDTMEIAEKSLNNADEAYAKVLAKSEYYQADKTLKKSRDLFESKKYYECYLLAVNADREAKNARNIALGKKGQLKDAIDETRVTLDEAKKYEAEKYVPEKVKLTEENLKIADNSYNDMRLKEGFSAIEVAKINADQAYLDALKEYSKKRIADAEIVVANAEKSKGAKFAKDEMEGAKESLGNARSGFAESRYKEAISDADESRRLAFLVINAKSGKDVKDTGDTDVSDEERKGYRLYKVKFYEAKKDCLWRIAQKFYKNPLLWKKIYEANKDKIKEPQLIKPGWVLKIPLLKKSEDKKSEDKEDEVKDEVN